jgi:hypothetical protein
LSEDDNFDFGKAILTCPPGIFDLMFADIMVAAPGRVEADARELL